MTAEQWVLVLLAYSVVVTVLFVVFDAAHADLRREVDQLRRRIHPSTRNRRTTP